MIKEKLITRTEGKPGKGGFSIFFISEEIKLAIVEHSSKLNVQIFNEKINILSNNVNSLDTSEGFINDLPAEWKEINYEKLESIGFSDSQLRQLYSKKLNVPQVIQESIEHFSFGLVNNEKFTKYTDPLNILMGVLRSGGRWIEKNYATSQEIALKSLLEEKKQRKEYVDNLIKEITELEFPAWEKGLSEEEKRKIVPENIFKTNMKMGILATLRTYFKETILLPRLREQKILD